jgi:hypothetical protein
MRLYISCGVLRHNQQYTIISWKQLFYNKFMSRTTMQIICASFWKNSIPTNFLSIHTLHIKTALKQKKFIWLFPSLEATLSLTLRKDRYIFAHFLSFFVSVAVERLTRSDGINQLWSKKSIKYVVYIIVIWS